MTNCTPTDVETRDGWTLQFSHYQPQDEKRREAIFALGNGLLMTRAASIDSTISAQHYPGTYRAGCYEQLRNKVAGQWDETESLANLPNWLPIRVRIGDADWLSLDQDPVAGYSHGLNLYSGIAWRRWSIRDTRGRVAQFEEQRIQSMAAPHLGAVCLKVTPVNWGRTAAATSDLVWTTLGFVIVMSWRC